MPPIPSRQEMGQGLAEYAIIAVLVGFVAIAGLLALGPDAGSSFSSINSSLLVGGIPIVINATEPPTQTPTATSDVPPTETPTAPPTETPTDTPTIAPTDTPTIAPTDTPTIAPTDTPTIAPTDTPTLAPTIGPTPTDLPWWCVYFPQYCG